MANILHPARDRNLLFPGGYWEGSMRGFTFYDFFSALLSLSGVLSWVKFLTRYAAEKL